MAAHVFVEDLERPQLEPADEHHLAKVLRLRPGQALSVGDGAGAYRLCVWTGARPEPQGPVEREPRPEPPITVAIALTKGAKPEWAVQRLTEAGIDHVQLLIAERSVVRWDEDQAGRAIGRLGRVAREAAMQSRRLWLPSIAGPVPFGRFVADPVVAGLGCLAHPGGGPPTLDRPMVAVGPEGGWSDAELASGLPLVGFAPSVLRAETAAVAAAVLFGALRGGFVHTGHT